MNILALLLVLLSTISHASWNLFAKRAIDQEVFLWCVLLSSSVLLLPLSIFLLLKYEIIYPGWLFISGTVALHVLYFMFLGRSYSRYDMSLAYPITRGIGSALVPIVGIFVLKEIVTTQAIIGVSSIVVGIFIMYWWGKFKEVLQDPLRILRETGGRYAIITGLLIAAYSIWDKVGVSYVNPFLYMYFLSLGSTLLLSPYIFKYKGIGMVRTELRERRISIIISGFLMFLTYALILIALQFSRVSYVMPARGLGVVIGVVFGIIFLNEPSGKGRIIGSSIIIFGLVLISLAP